MELILENLDLILTAVVILLSAVILARRGQISLLRELILSLVLGTKSDDEDESALVERVKSLLPPTEKLPVSETKVEQLIADAEKKAAVQE
ncbi:MAG: hypothetical protein IJ493_12155 [Clostridia bacterium]|nr:hypothetical protein [Clostridia bacterium]